MRNHAPVNSANPKRFRHPAGRSWSRALTLGIAVIVLASALAAVGIPTARAQAVNPKADLILVGYQPTASLAQRLKTATANGLAVDAARSTPYFAALQTAGGANLQATLGALRADP